MRTWWPLVAVCLGSFLFLLDTTVVAVALPDIGRDLSGDVTASLATLEWVPNGYTLVLAVLMLSAGSVADRLGQRRACLGGLGVFGVASLACALAPGTGWLVAARCAQGIGGAALAVTGFALVAAAYQGRRRSTAIGVYFAVNSLAAAVGPIVGGLLTEHLGWRSIFFVNVPVVVLTMAMSAWALPADPARAGRPARLDLPGMALFAVFAAGATFGLTSASEHGWASPATVAALAVAVAALVGFLAVEARRADGVLDVSLLRTAAFASALVACAVWSVVFAALVFTSVWLQAGLGLGPVAAGLAMVPLAGAAFLTSTVAGRALHGRSPRLTVGAGLVLNGVGCALQTGLDADSGPAALTLGLVVTGIGVGLAGPALGSAVLAAAPPHRAGMASGAMSTTRQLGQTLGVAAFGILFQAGDGAVTAGLVRVNMVAAALSLLAGLLAVAFFTAPAGAGDQAMRR
ncbi:MFS transporter [Pseudonocardia acaciae]|uniref:MFS transporter n=1 Tax=Pseudonocardia acaciae TaxID=551276 RepID=UPI00048B45C3|nr:MFS transporter [Pseudonocardia acaciae]